LLNQSSSRCGGGVDTVFEFGHFFTGSLGLLFGCSHDRFQWPERVSALVAEKENAVYGAGFFALLDKEPIVIQVRERRRAAAPKNSLRTFGELTRRTHPPGLF
jgi:hypothetical protein